MRSGGGGNGGGDGLCGSGRGCGSPVGRMVWFAGEADVKRRHCIRVDSRRPDE